MQRTGLIGYYNNKITDVMESKIQWTILFDLWYKWMFLCFLIVFIKISREECNSNYKQYYSLLTQTRYYENKTC
jgi:hypothetical protein